VEAERNCTKLKSSDWQKDMQSSCRSSAELTHTRDISTEFISANTPFQMLIPQTFLKEIKLSDKNDPLLKQVLPTTEEYLSHNSESSDPVGDLKASEGNGIIHKYPGRVLLVTTGACAIHCRYCFRKDFPYNALLAAKNNWKSSVQYLMNHPEVHEVILSGGDPLTLSTVKLQQLTDQLSKIPHIQTIRIHTRIPTVLPSRINAAFLTWLKSLSVNTVMVIHTNHANELTESSRVVLRDIATCDCLILNQSVLLNGVNDSFEALKELSLKLHKQGVLPYYLHQLDKAKGTQHFSVSDNKALELMKHLRENLPGYLVPKLVREIAGEKSKTPIGLKKQHE